MSIAKAYADELQWHTDRQPLTGESWLLTGKKLGEVDEVSLDGFSADDVEQLCCLAILRSLPIERVPKVLGEYIRLRADGHHWLARLEEGTR